MRMVHIPIPGGLIAGFVPLTEREIRDAMARGRRELQDYFTSRYSDGGWTFNPDDIEYAVPERSRTVIALGQVERP